MIITGLVSYNITSTFTKLGGRDDKERKLFIVEYTTEHYVIDRQQ